MSKNTIPDSETRATAEHAKDLRLWLRMLACTNLIENHVRARLRSDFDITLPRFDLMSQLERSPQGLKMGELSKRMMVTGGNVTGITDQLVREGPWWYARTAPRIAAPTSSS
jgi:DNA-binding MarR family transcriptional regulator